MPGPVLGAMPKFLSLSVSSLWFHRVPDKMGPGEEAKPAQSDGFCGPLGLRVSCRQPLASKKIAREHGRSDRKSLTHSAASQRAPSALFLAERPRLRFLTQRGPPCVLARCTSGAYLCSKAKRPAYRLGGPGSCRINSSGRKPRRSASGFRAVRRPSPHPSRSAHGLTRRRRGRWSVMHERAHAGAGESTAKGTQARNLATRCLCSRAGCNFLRHRTRRGTPVILGLCQRRNRRRREGCPSVVTRHVSPAAPAVRSSSLLPSSARPELALPRVGVASNDDIPAPCESNCISFAMRSLNAAFQRVRERPAPATSRW